MISTVANASWAASMRAKRNKEALAKLVHHRRSPSQWLWIR
jgi:hypothetical protein